jgi:hypothetical protein
VGQKKSWPYGCSLVAVCQGREPFRLNGLIQWLCGMMIVQTGATAVLFKLLH